MPYHLRVLDGAKIYDKLLCNSSLAAAPCAPNTLKMMAQFAVLIRIKESEDSNIFSKVHVYSGRSLEGVNLKVESYQRYRDFVGIDEGTADLSTRLTFKASSKVFNFGGTEVTANPVHLLYVLEQQIERKQFLPKTESRLMSYIEEYLASSYVESIGKEIQISYLESYPEYGQNIFDRYVTFVDP